ncbi:MAG TPA: carbamoyltransferase C-terminal domain-containing protein [Polyangiaceae bacterium]|nr:carbamoyltransferase C-terminal domain-containing protein [Polyangiaceae bacterium]
MNILGLHFGHDAAVCILRDGRIAAYVMRERHARIKHAISLEFKTIQMAMAEAQLGWSELDYCAITSTQNIELIIDDAAAFSIQLQRHPGHQAPCPLGDLIDAQGLAPKQVVVDRLLKIFYDPRYKDSYLYRHYGHAFPEHRTRERESFSWVGTMDQFIGSPDWAGAPLDRIAAIDYSPTLKNESVRQGFHYPVTVRVAGHDLPGYFIAHHMAHAASNFYQSGFDQAAILTHDGYADGRGYLSGMFFWGEGHRIRPITPHHLIVGALYENVGIRLGMGDVGPPGKLMGLAAYGRPRFFDRRFVGNQYDWLQAQLDTNVWLKHCLELAGEMGYDLEPFGKSDQVLAPINVDIAASTQKLFEETYLVAVDAVAKVIEKVGARTDNLSLSGGCALNCPSNSRLFRESRFRNLFVEPGCDDSGLAIGAASWLYHNVLDQPLPERTAPARADPYLGIKATGSADIIQAAIHAVGDQVHFTICPDAAESAAEDLAADKVIGWFEGRSEIGPRALGHRSVLADPRQGANWERVNLLKGREKWRPFAPAVLESEAETWFQGLPRRSPYMLFTGTVRSHDLPAITHADGSARVQTVDSSCGEFFRVIQHFFAKTGIPVVLNTSFNGPGEPIVETPDNALRFLLHSKLDALYIGGMRVTRRGSAPSQS